MEKYEFSEEDAKELADFLVPIFDFVPEKRPTAAQCLNHPWITRVSRNLGSVVPCETDNKNLENNMAVQNNTEKDEREAMEVRMGNIAIGGV